MKRKPAILTKYESLLSVAKTTRKWQQAKGKQFREGVEEHAARAGAEAAPSGEEMQIDAMEAVFQDYLICDGADGTCAHHSHSLA
jgi:hypothetical protein